MAMAGSHDSSSYSSASILWRRYPASSRPRPPPVPPLHADIDPPPRPRPAFQSLAFGLIVVLCGLQFLPATHFRDPADPYRNWIPIGPNRSQPVSTTPMDSITKEEYSGVRKHIFSWTDCLDLRVLTVLANSTLLSSRDPENIFFHFFVSENEDEKLSYYKLKVLLPQSNLEIVGLKDLKETPVFLTSERELLLPLLPEIVPFVLPSINSWKNKFLYVSPHTIIKGNIEEIFDVDMGAYAIAAAEDCRKRLGDYVNIDVLNAIQRTAAKTWVSKKPYDKNACLPDPNLLLLDARRLDDHLIDSIIWWSKILGPETQRVNQTNPAIILAIYERYLKLPDSWKVHGSSTVARESETNVLPFDGPIRVCSEDSDQQERSNLGNLWKNYITPNYKSVLSHRN